MFSTLTKSGLTKILCFLILIGAFYNSYAQVVQTKRFEIGIGSSFESYSVVPLDTGGIVLYRSFTGPTENQLEITRLDTALQVIWKGFLPVSKELSVVSAKMVANKIYIFFEDRNSN